MSSANPNQLSPEATGAFARMTNVACEESVM